MIITGFENLGCNLSCVYGKIEHPSTGIKNSNTVALPQFAIFRGWGRWPFLNAATMVENKFVLRFLLFCYYPPAEGYCHQRSGWVGRGVSAF